MNLMQKLVKTFLHENQARNSGKNLLLRKDCVGMLVTKLQYTNAGENALNSSLWEKERMEMLAKNCRIEVLLKAALKCCLQ